MVTRVHSFVTGAPALFKAHFATLKAKRLANG
jgi:hypothetical protein